MAAIFGEGKIFGKLQRLHSLDPLWVENFAEIALSRTVKEIEANLCFAIFGKNSKIQNGRHFWGIFEFLGKTLLERFRRNFRPIRRCKFAIFIASPKMAAIFGNFRKFLPKRFPLWVENFAEIALSRTVKEIEANLCFAIFGKNSKIQNGRHFWGGENFWKIAKIAFLRYPVGRKFRRNRSISHG